MKGEGNRSRGERYSLPGELAGKDWIWIERPNGERFMLLDGSKEVTLPECAVKSLARQEEQAAS